MPEIATPDLKTDTLTAKQCPVCERIKYYYLQSAPHPSFIEPQKMDIFKTREFFGDGRSANNQIIVSQRLFRQIIATKVRGVGFTPLVDNPEKYIKEHLE